MTSILTPGEDLSVDIVRHNANNPARVRITAETRDEVGTGFPHFLNVYIVWRELSIQELLTRADPAAFDAYLAALPMKMQERMSVRPIHFGSRTQWDLMEVLRLDHFDA